MKLRLIAGSGNGRKSTVPVAFKVRVLELVNTGKPSKAAIEEAAGEFELELKPSYTKFAGSHVWRFRKEIQKLIDKEDQETIELVKAAGLVEEVEEESAE
ncbi:MAG: hypothetical protein DRP09_20070 [Candidatus Thorarchaeota archaeon]|nr:MAG: hypothetical protein DRP09_20070 [Candidatus Thorarchaeota archaeon]